MHPCTTTRQPDLCGNDTDAAAQRKRRRKRHRPMPPPAQISLSYHTAFVASSSSSLVYLSLLSSFCLILLSATPVSSFVLPYPHTYHRCTTNPHFLHNNNYLYQHPLYHLPHLPQCRLSATAPQQQHQTASSSSLEDLTVKELRDRIKALATTERGTLSRLKRKQDLIEYLQQQQQAPKQNDTPEQVHESRTSSAAEAAPRQRTQRAPPLQMPTLDKEPSPQAKESPTTTSTTTTHTLTLKEAAFERVYQRFPVLRNTAVGGNRNQENEDDDGTTDNDNDTTTQDIRQWQHPIFRHNNVTTDMDVVFVGTASCTPGVTRGVSCTALRLNWRRQTAQWNAAKGRMEQQADPFQGGTWLFDVGECTQVCVCVCVQVCVHVCARVCI